MTNAFRHNEPLIRLFASADGRVHKSVLQTRVCWRRYETITSATDKATEAQLSPMSSWLPWQKHARAMTRVSASEENAVLCHDSDVRSG
ncbi:hypothetical protein QY76_16130 [Edwardsiella sp. EA181011]|nr:hypothetical protein QY76_16130 [Edwardsiella sp. EA181011]